jgi:hypothetical protein
MARINYSRALAVLAAMAVAAVVAVLTSALLPQEAKAEETCQTTTGGSFHVCISNTASPNPVKKGKPLTFTIKVTNACTPEQGCSFTDNITDFLRSPRVKFVSGTFTGPHDTGDCTEDSPGTVRCGSFFLDHGESATATITAKPTKTGRFANTAVETDFSTQVTKHYRVK